MMEDSLGLGKRLAQTRIDTIADPGHRGMNVPAIGCCLRPLTWWFGPEMCRICFVSLRPAFWT